MNGITVLADFGMTISGPLSPTRYGSQAFTLHPVALAPDKKAPPPILLSCDMRAIVSRILDFAHSICSLKSL